MSTIRLTIVPGDHFDFAIKPFDQITVSEYIRIHAPMPEGLTPLENRHEMLLRYSGAPSRYVRHMSMDEADRALKYIADVTKSLSDTKTKLNKVHETLKNWQEEHGGEEWTHADAKGMLEEFGIFCDRIEVEGKVYTAPEVEGSPFGKWIDLQAQMDVSTTEAESYVRSMSIMMDGPDGVYPVQGEYEDDNAYNVRRDAYTAERQRLFYNAPWVQAMGISAFFFSKSQRFAAITGHNMTLLNSWLSPKSKREPRVIPSVGEFMPN